MKRLKVALELLFPRDNHDASDDPGSHESLDRVSREIKGSIFTLLTLFELVALTSYIPLDSFNIFHGRLEHMNNLGGIVGAIAGEWLLGTVGVMGYVIIPLTLWLAICAFRGIALHQNLLKIVGVFLGTVMGAMTCHLLWNDQFPEASLMQGGYIGKLFGSNLREYFNTTGSILIISFGFVLTLILTTGFSTIDSFKRLFEENEEDIETDDCEENDTPATKVNATPRKAMMPAKKTRKSHKKNADSGLPPEPKSLDDEDDTATEEQSEKTQTLATDEEKIFSFTDLLPFKGAYSLPAFRLLKNYAGSAKRMSKGELKENARKLCQHLLSFQITGDVTEIAQGPVLTTYEYKPNAGMKLSKIAAVQDDLGIALASKELRIVAPIPGKTVVGIEVPRPNIETIGLKDILEEKAFHDKKIRVPIAIGKSTTGEPLFTDLAAMPHLLVAGATGSGKSVFVNCLIMSLLFRLTPQQLRMILIDPKMLELNVFDGLPHLLTNVITDNRIAFNALSWAVMEMDRRYELMARTHSKNIDSYNEKVKSSIEKLPYIVIVVDELADLMLSGGEAVEIAITRLAQKARAAGIHMVIATQRPSTDVVTGLIKANIPSRLSFKVPSGIDSRTVLDASGAEELIGRGDGLMLQPGVPLRRIHACFVSEEELKKTVKYCKGGKDHSDIYLDFSGKNPASDD